MSPEVAAPLVETGDTAARTSRRAARLDPAWVRVLDGVTEGGVLAFAAWTLFYELALATQWVLWWPARVWLVLAVLLVGWRVVAALREPGEPGSVHPREPGPTPWLPVAAALVLLLGLGALRDVIGAFPAVLAALVVVTAGLLGQRRRWGRGPAPDRGPVRVQTWEHVVAAVGSLGLALLAAWRHAGSGDDVYYVNRAVWVAERGTPTLRDTMFSTGELPSTYGSGLPLASVEAWQGAVAHVLHLEAPTFVFLWTVPVLGAATGWATWRLVRTWAPRRAALVLVLALLFALYSTGTVVGRYFIGVIWEGKVPAVTIVIPLVWHHLTRLARRPRPVDALLLAALGTCFVGLTSSAVLMAPVIAAGGLLAALVLRSRACAVGAASFVAFPLAAGVASTLGPPTGGAAPTALGSEIVYAYFLGEGAPMLLALVATALAVRIVPGRAGVVAACASLSGLVSLLPGVGTLVNLATGAGPVAWRMAFGIPIAVLVGMLGALPAPRADPARRLRALAAAAAPALVAAVVVAVTVTQTPLWSPKTASTLRLGAWKLDLAALRDVRAALDVRTPSGPWLLPPAQMGVLAMTTTRHPAVVPRDFYLVNLHTTAQDLADRRLLFALVRGQPVRPSDVRDALGRLGVTLACVRTGQDRAVRTLRSAVGAPLREVGDMSCHEGRVEGG